MRYVVTSLGAHVLVLLLVVQPAHPPPQAPTSIATAVTDQPAAMLVEMVDVPHSTGGGAAPGDASAQRVRSRVSSSKTRSTDAWSRLAVHMEPDQGGGHIGSVSGTGVGDGAGARNGIGFGNGGGVRVDHDVPAPPVPVPPPVSKARPARLIWPTRNLEVTDDAALFVARVTVDTDGSVVGARMIKTRPGARGDDAANAIWTFRYAPALDDAGKPIRSTLEQEFQVR